MKMTPTRLAALGATLLLAGCVSDDTPEAERFLSAREQKSALARAMAPQEFGFTAFPLPDGGIGFNGALRTHPNHLTSAEFISGSIPAIEMKGKSRRTTFTALLDPSTASTWLEFDTAKALNVNYLAQQEQQIAYRGINNTGGVPAYAAVAGQMRIDQFIVENIPLYVRMAAKSLGPLNRGVLSPKIDAVLGWSFLREMEYIQFNFRENGVKLSATHAYLPHNDLLMAQVPIVKLRGFGLAVQGSIDGKPTPIILDLAHDSQFWRGDQRVRQTKQVSLGDLVFRKVPTSLMPPNTSAPRAGRQMLEPYIITICPKQGLVYFERFPE